MAVERPSDHGPPPPTHALLELLGRRWALRILWELREGALPFTQLQARCDGMSRSVLSQRLTELREAHLIELDGDGDGGYRLTEPGTALLARMRYLDDWATEWSKLWTTAFRARSGG